MYVCMTYIVCMYVCIFVCVCMYLCMYVCMIYMTDMFVCMHINFIHTYTYLILSACVIYIYSGENRVHPKNMYFLLPQAHKVTCRLITNYIIIILIVILFP